MDIEVKIEKVFGINKVYPVSKNAHHLADLAGTITFTARALKIIEALGYTITIKQPTLEELRAKGADHVEH